MNTEQNLHAAIRETRDCGEVTVAIEARPTLSDAIAIALDEFVAQFNFHGLGAGWKEIELQTAREIATEILFRDLAHGVKTTTPEHASDLAERFLKNFADEAHFFTNSSFESGRLSHWYPISEATFDTGIVVLDGQKIGILWVQDED